MKYHSVDPCFSKGIPFPDDASKPIRTQEQPDAIVLNSSTGKYPQPLEDTKYESPARLAAAQALAIKNARYPKL